MFQVKPWYKVALYSERISGEDVTSNVAGYSREAGSKSVSWSGGGRSVCGEVQGMKGR